MNKKIALGLGVGLLSIMMTGCEMMPPAEQVMGPVKCNYSMQRQSKKVAYITWHSGKVIPAMKVHRGDGTLGGTIGALIATHVDQNQRRNQMEFKYGKAQQVVFMTSLRDALQEQGAFKKVKLVARAPQLDANTALIDIDFKKTVVAHADGAYPIELDVMVSYKDGRGRKHKRLVQVKPDSGFWQNFFGKRFVDSQSDISEQLMRHVLSEIDTATV